MAASTSGTVIQQTHGFLTATSAGNSRLACNDAANLPMQRGYSFLGVPESHHVCSHHGNRPESKDKYTRIVTFHTQKFAQFVQQLKDTPDSDGSLLDHTLLMYGSGMGNGNLHEKFDPPTVTIGGANGRWIANRSTVAQKGASACNLLVNLAEVFDIELERIGPSTGKLAI